MHWVRPWQTGKSHRAPRGFPASLHRARLIGKERLPVAAGDLQQDFRDAFGRGFHAGDCVEHLTSHIEGHGHDIGTGYIGNVAAVMHPAGVAAPGGALAAYDPIIALGDVERVDAAIVLALASRVCFA